MRMHKRKLKWDEEGVASTVGTVMALLVFLTFLSLIVNQYVPVWMKDAEAAHMNTAFGQFGEFKGVIDSQVLAATIAQFVERHYTPVPHFSPVTLGVEGVPIFTSPTTGELTSNPEKGPWTVEFVYLISGNNTKVEESNSGNIVLKVFNRYYVQQSLIFENGGLLKDQFDGEVVGAEPAFTVDVKGNNYTLAFTLISIFGKTSSSGIGTTGIHSKLIGLDRQEYVKVKSSIYINHTTSYGHAWYHYFNNTLSKAFGITKEDYGTSGYTYVRTETSESVDNPQYSVSWQKTGDDLYKVKVEIKNDVNDSNPDSLAIDYFELDHAFVNVAVGEQGGDVEI